MDRCGPVATVVVEDAVDNSGIVEITSGVFAVIVVANDAGSQAVTLP